MTQDTPAPQKPHAELLYSDELLLAANKPAGVFVTPQTLKVGLPDLLREGAYGLPADAALHVVQRINENASGVALYAYTAAAAKKLAAQFAAGTAQTTYHALVGGYVDEPEGTIDVLLYYDKRAGVLRASDRRGKPAQTHYRVLERVAGNTWLECRCEPDRSDQLRIHLAAIGHPLTVDPQFGGGQAIRLSEYKPRYRPNRRGEERPLIDRLTLHVAELTLSHPQTNEQLTITAPLPKDLRATLNQLGRLC